MAPVELARSNFRAYLKIIERLVKEVLRPNEFRLTHEDGVPDDLTQELRQYGLFAMTLPAEYGGLDLTT